MSQKVLQMAAVSTGFFLATTAFGSGPLPQSTVRFVQPYISGVSSVFVYNPQGPTPAGDFVVGQNFPSPLGRDFPYAGSIGNFTGFYPVSPITAQVDIQPTWWGGTTVQAEGGTVGIMINTGSSISPTTKWPTIFPVVAGINFDTVNAPIRPWIHGPNGGVIYSVDSQVPFAVSTDNIADSQGHSSASYLGGYVSILDTSTNLTFWYGAGLYDHRGMGPNPDYVAPDKWLHGTGWPIVESAASIPGQINATGNLYSTSVWGSAGFQTETWTGFRNLSFAISGRNILNAIAEIRATSPAYANLSTNLADYAISSMNYDPEIAYSGSSGVLATSFQNLKLTVTDSLPVPFFRLWLPQTRRHFYTASVSEAIGVIKGGGILIGNAGQVYADAPAGTSLTPLYRLYLGSVGDHFYTTSWAEVQNATKLGYTYIGVAGYIPNLSNCSVNLYRAFSNTAGHFYSTSKAEAQTVSPIEATYCINP